MDDFEYNSHYPMLAAGEAILWKGKPKKGAFIASRSLTLLPIAVVWLCFDSMLIGQIFDGGSDALILIPFTLLHLMPVWLWLGSMLTAGKRWKNTNYYVTNRRIIIQDGFLAVNENSLFYKDMRNAQVRIGLLDKLFHTGDILIDHGVITARNTRHPVIPTLEDLEDPHGVYNRIQKIILDMQTDMEYPNAFRPAENPGYQTDYRPYKE